MIALTRGLPSPTVWQQRRSRGLGDEGLSRAVPRGRQRSRKERTGVMDKVQKSFYGLQFRIAFLEKKGTEFQDWFCKLASYAWGEDFEAVRPYGSQGDFKCDGRRISTRAIIQCYAPLATRENPLNKKIREDFLGAKEHWPNMAQWIFVFNDNSGLPPTSIQLLDRLRAENPDIDIHLWTEAKLRGLAEAMPAHAWEDIFGLAPSQDRFESLALEDIQPLIEELARLEPKPGQEPLDPPSVEKLERNALSADAAELLKLGRRKEALVEKYFQNAVLPDLGERIAVAFRHRYAQLKADALSADQIFSELQRFTDMADSPARQGAALAVLSYYFERCDIFEDANEEAT